MLAAIPYTTFPDIELGPLTLRTFGLMVGIGVLLGAWVAGRHGEQFGVPREQTYSMATRMVVAGVIGARLTWDITHWDQIDTPLDLIAVWEGGLQFSGGFVAAIIVGFPTFRRWPRLTRWRLLDGYAIGLALGLAIGRIGCYSVGEHFGSTTSFFLATRYEGGSTREELGDEILRVGDTFHNTSLYEFGYLLVLVAVLAAVVRPRADGSGPAPGTAIGIFCLYYAVARGGSDLLRVNDETVLGLTGAQYLCLALIPTSIWILTKVRRRTAELVAVEDDARTDVAIDTAD
ncbi:prolipoprotein diacylglyceryl transferase [soil metagenome]